MKAIAYYPVGMALKPPLYLNFGDAPDTTILAPGIVQRIAERTGINELRALIGGNVQTDTHSYPIAKLPILLRQLVWWDGKASDPLPLEDYVLPTVGVVKMVGCVGEKPVVLAVTVGHNDGHHSHVDVASFVYHYNGENLIPDAGRGKYAKSYFRQQRYDNIFNNAYSHNIPRINGQLQQPGPEFGGNQQYYGTIIEHGTKDGLKFTVVDFHTAYDVPELTLARRTLMLNPKTGEAFIHDQFAFAGNTPALPIEEAFVTWDEVQVKGDTVTITGKKAQVILHAKGAAFAVEALENESRANERPAILKRITAQVNGTDFTLHITPKDI
jgi:hypothetical protein